MGKLLIIRHGHTGLNMPGRDERLRGWLDVPLDNQGLEEATETAELIADRYQVDTIYSSDLRRARQTAEAVRQRLKSRITHTSDLRPWNLGVFSGQRIREILPFLNLLNQHPEMAAPNGESYHQFYGRYSLRLKELLCRAEESDNCIAVVTHVRNLLASSTIILGGDKNKVPVKGGPVTGALVVVEKTSGIWNMRRCSNNVPIATRQQQDVAALVASAVSGPELSGAQA